MTNAEKYLKDGVDVEEFVKDIFNPINKATNTTFEYTPYINSKELKKYLKKEIKPYLTEEERVILRNIDEVYTEIDRTSNDYLEVSYKAEDNIRRFYGLPYKHLFQFIAERRTILYWGTIKWIK